MKNDNPLGTATPSILITAPPGLLSWSGRIRYSRSDPDWLSLVMLSVNTAGEPAGTLVRTAGSIVSFGPSTGCVRGWPVRGSGHGSHGHELMPAIVSKIGVPYSRSFLTLTLNASPMSSSDNV